MVGEVLDQMSRFPCLMGRDVRMITGQNWVYRIIPVILPKAAFKRLNGRLTRFGTREISRAFMAREYDKAHQMTLGTLEQRFHDIKSHFEAHANQIRPAWKTWTVKY